MIGKADISMLLDYYGAFLTERKRELMRMSADEDMSLAEIAEAVGVSRQGVRDAIAQGEKQLLKYEAGLKLVERDRQMREIIGRITLLIEKSDIAISDRMQIVSELNSLMSMMEDRDGV